MCLSVYLLKTNKQTNQMPAHERKKGEGADYYKKLLLNGRLVGGER